MKTNYLLQKLPSKPFLAKTQLVETQSLQTFSTGILIPTAKLLNFTPAGHRQALIEIGQTFL